MNRRPLLPRPGERFVSYSARLIVQVLSTARGRWSAVTGWSGLVVGFTGSLSSTADAAAGLVGAWFAENRWAVAAAGGAVFAWTLVREIWLALAEAGGRRTLHLVVANRIRQHSVEWIAVPVRLENRSDQVMNVGEVWTLSIEDPSGAAAQVLRGRMMGEIRPLAPQEKFRVELLFKGERPPHDSRFSIRGSTLSGAEITGRWPADR